jgi:hypothetical protein
VSATAALLAEARQSNSALIPLVKVSLTTPSARTLYLSVDHVTTPNLTTPGDPDQIWEVAISKVDPIRAPGAFLGTGPDLCMAGFTLLTKRALGFQVNPKNIGDLFVDFRWIGATVEIYLWSRRLTLWADALRVFKGVVQNYDIGLMEADVRLLQRRDWNKIVSPNIVTKGKYPRAPERSLGLPLSICYGAVKGPPFRAPYADFYSASQHSMEHVSGGQVGIPGVLVDTGRGGASQKGKVVVASHSVKTLNVGNSGTGFYLDQSNLLVPLEPPGGDVFNTAGVEAGFLVADEFRLASYPISPSEAFIPAATPCDDPRNALDPFNETTFARFTYQPSPLIDKRIGEWRLPDVPSPGDADLTKVYVHCGYKSSATLTNFQVGLRRIGPAGAPYTTIAASLTPTRVVVGPINLTDWGVGTHAPTTPWAWSECNLVAFWNAILGLPVAREDVWLYLIGLEVVYAPERRIYQPGYRLPLTVRRHHRAARPDRPYQLLNPGELVPADTEIEASFFATLEGYQDSGGGTYTGVGNALIEKPPDVLAHFQTNYGDGDFSRLETGSGVFGSLVDARATLKTWRQGDMKLGIFISEISDAATQLERMLSSCASWLYLDRYTDKWHMVPWQKGVGTQYPRKVYKEDLLEFSADLTPDTAVISGLKVPYGYDGRSREYRMNTHASRISSNSGWAWKNIRDQHLTITTGVNDKLDFATLGGAFTATVAGSAYADGHAAAAALDAAMETADAGRDFMVCYGGSVRTGYNDKLDINDGAVKVATVANGDYATMEALATAYQSALNAASLNWTVAYSRTTRKFTVDRTAGTKTLLSGTGANKATTAYTLIGYNSSADVTGGTVAQDVAEEDLFQIECLGSAMDLLLASGTNGSNATTPKSVAEVYGFDGAYDRDAQGAARHWVGDCPKGTREQKLDAAATAYGHNRELVVEGRAIYDTDTARELRNRLVDLLSEPRVRVRMRTARMPDLERGRLVQFADLDDWMKYPKQGSNGLWAGKSFRVLEVVQHMGPTFEQEVLAVEND